MSYQDIVGLAANCNCNRGLSLLQNGGGKCHCRPAKPELRDRLGWPLAIAASAVLHYSGALGMIERIRRWTSSPRIVVSAYHRVSNDDAPSCRNLCVSPANFRKQMEYVARGPYRPVSLSEIAEHLDGRKELDEDAIAVTFDDGYRDVFENAAPVLREFNLPATVFLTTGLIDSQGTPWWDRLGRVVEQLRLARAANDSPDRRIPQFIWSQCRGAAEAANPKAAAAATNAINELLKSLGQQKREEILAGLEACAGAVNQDSLMLTWDMIREMRGDAITFGAHTVTHPLLSQVSLPEMQAEILDSKQRIEDVLGEEVRFFAYPNGGPSDFNQQVTAMVREAGLKLAFTMSSGANGRRADLLCLKRYGVPNVPAYALAARLSFVR